MSLPGDGFAGVASKRACPAIAGGLRKAAAREALGSEDRAFLIVWTDDEVSVVERRGVA